MSISWFAPVIYCLQIPHDIFIAPYVHSHWPLNLCNLLLKFFSIKQSRNIINSSLSQMQITKIVLHFNYLKLWTAIDKLSTIYKFDLADKIKQDFFQAVAMAVLLYSCTTWTIKKWLNKKLDEITQRCCMLFWTNPRRNILQNSNCMATYLPSHKPPK